MSFRAGASLAGSDDVLLLPHWRDEDWRQLFGFASIRKVAAGDALIRKGEAGRALYFVLRGKLEVYPHSGGGISMGPVATVRAGSVLGEQAFFDGGPRSASAWAVEECEVAALAQDQFTALEKGSPALARDLLFALGRILSIRLRKTTAKVKS
jgi:CRP/FNR family transcriptional regulator, cyclic AMP receptor protein